jgi:hypothetical protein
VDCKAEVCNLKLTVLDEDVGWFDVAVNDVATGEVLEPLEELTNMRP